MADPAPPGARPVPAILFPACDEAEALPGVLAEFRAFFPPGTAHLIVGVNGSRDRTADVAAAAGAMVASTASRGYGHGCMAAIGLAEGLEPQPEVYAFAAADGATDPRDVGRVIERVMAGYDLVLGERESTPANRPVLGRGRSRGNRILARWAGALTGVRFRDLGPVRAIRAEWIARIAPREMHLGWTIEMQVRAARLGARIAEIPVSERPRTAGSQKVSGGSALRSLRIGWAIAAAGWAAAARGRSDGSSTGVRS